MNLRPALIMALSSTVAVICCALSIWVNIILAICACSLALLILTALLVYALYKKNLNLSVITVICAGLFIIISCGFLSVTFKFNALDKLYGNHVIEGKIISIESFTECGYEDDYSVTVETTVNSIKTKALLYIKSSPFLFEGYKIKVVGEAYNPDYYNKTYALSSGVTHTFANCKVLSIKDDLNGFNLLKLKIFTAYKKAMPRSYAVVYGMLTGNTAYILNEVKMATSYTGIAHVFAVSGLHVSLLAGILFLFLKFLKAKRIVRFVICSVILFLYTWFCNFTVSSLRAFIIIFVSNLANALFYKPDKLSALCLAMTVALIINPLDFFSVGFALSFTAYFSLVFISPKINKFLSKFTFNGLSSYISFYVAPFLLTAPILLDNFSSISLISIVLNMAFVPIFATMFAFSFAFTPLILISPIFNFLYALIDMSLHIICHILSVSNFKIFLVRRLNFGVSAVFYYLIFIVIANFIKTPKKVKCCLLIGLVTLLISSFAFVNFIVLP